MSAPAVVRAVVADDEPEARGAVLTLLAEFPHVQVVAEARNGHEAVAAVREHRPDLLLLDIQMPDKDGFGVIEALGEDVPRGIVFITAHDEHALRAFEVHALDFVLKPFGRPRFAAVMSRAIERLDAMDALVMRRTLASMTDDRRRAGEPVGEWAPDEARHTPPRRIGVRNGAKVVVVDIDAIEWVEAFGDYARIHAGTHSHVIAQRMHELERTLEAGEFVRIHRSLIVNLKRVRELHRDPDGAGTLVLDGGVRLRVARGRWEALQAALRMEQC